MAAAAAPQRGPQPPPAAGGARPGIARPRPCPGRYRRPRGAPGSRARRGRRAGVRVGAPRGARCGGDAEGVSPGRPTRASAPSRAESAVLPRCRGGSRPEGGSALPQPRAEPRERWGLARAAERGGGSGANRFVVGRAGLGARRCPREGPAAWPRVSGDSGSFFLSFVSGVASCCVFIVIYEGMRGEPVGMAGREVRSETRAALARGWAGGRSRGRCLCFPKAHGTLERWSRWWWCCCLLRTDRGLWKSRASSG